MHDAEFGIGMYRYYADVAPAYLRFLRWLFLMPGGDRVDGLRQLERAATEGELVRGEAQYQIHVIYLWYEQKWREALVLMRGLQARYPHNPHFRQVEAGICLFSRTAASLKASDWRSRARARCTGPHWRNRGAAEHGAPTPRARTARSRRRRARRDHRSRTAGAGRRARARAPVARRARQIDRQITQPIE